MMKVGLISLRQHFVRMRMAYVVLILSLIPTALVYYRVRVNVEARDQVRFEQMTHERLVAIEKRIPRIVDELLGMRGLFAVNASVSPDQWQRYVASLDLGRFSGIQALGYLEQVRAGQQEDFLARLRAREGPDGQIQPPGQRPVYYPVLY